jgi:hypothetical protein
VERSLQVVGGKPAGKKLQYLENICIDGRIILKWIFK